MELDSRGLGKAASSLDANCPVWEGQQDAARGAIVWHCGFPDLRLQGEMSMTAAVGSIAPSGTYRKFIEVIEVIEVIECTPPPESGSPPNNQTGEPLEAFMTR